MKQGSTFVLIVNLNVDLSRINSVIFTLKNKDVTLTKENWTYNNGKFDLPFTQEETVQLQGRTRIEAQINFADGNVAKTQIKDIYIKETLATRIIDDNIATQEGREVELVVEEDVIFTSEDYSKLANKPKINGVVLLGDVSLDALNIASKEYVEEEIAKFDFIKIVSELPEVGLPNRIYFVPKSNTSDNDLFDEYAWVNEQWEYYGTKQIEVDLTEYVKKTDYANFDKAGVIRGDNLEPYNGGVFAKNGVLYLSGSLKGGALSETFYNNRKVYSVPVLSNNLDRWIKIGLTDNTEEWTEEEKAKALELLGGVPMISQKDRILTVNSSGEVIGMAYNSESQGSTIVYRNKDGNIGVGTPTADSHATPKKYVEDNFVGNTEVSTSAIEYKIVKRIVDGQINVPKTPQTDAHATSKKYVDDLISQLRTELGLG